MLVFRLFIFVTVSFVMVLCLCFLFVFVVVVLYLFALFRGGKGVELGGWGGGKDLGKAGRGGKYDQNN